MAIIDICSDKSNTRYSPHRNSQLKLGGGGPRRTPRQKERDRLQARERYALRDAGKASQRRTMNKLSGRYARATEQSERRTGSIPLKKGFP